MCGKCCKSPMVMITKPEDYRRWVRQGRTDILKYATEPPPRGYGDLLADTNEGWDTGYCPFIRKVSQNRYICSIQETKPKVCREFRCEWSYGIGKKGIPFKTDCGWTDRAIHLGYGKVDSVIRV
jgi:Fe-S-cluster containining protein